MEESEISNQGGYQLISWKSWTAYVAPALFSGVFLLIAAPAAWGLSPGLSMMFAMFGVAYGAFAFFTVRSYSLFADDAGVWVHGGILPWSKGTTGVKWRDLDSASFMTGFSSWLFKSHTIHIGHRYTKTSEILLTHMAFGRDAVMAINEKHQARVAQQET